MKKVLFIFFSVILLACSHQSDKDKIRQAFSEWVEKKLNQSNFVPKDSCNPSYVVRHLAKGKPIVDMALPENKKIKFLFADINNDNELDGLVTFRRRCCSCTVPVAMPQSQVLILSGENGYTVNDTFFVEFYQNKKYSIYIDSIARGKFLGTTNKYIWNHHFIYTDSVRSDTFKIRTFSIIYKTKEFKIITEKKISINKDTSKRNNDAPQAIFGN
ncbi:MAG: hypothetical protein HY063_04155 [Bacteroidetes bacterium]|nr:hypothetical protein [Bacteroidota bacterium]